MGNIEQFDVIVIGSGPAGANAAIRCAQKGARTAVIEQEKCGGTCLNWGCIPTKFLWEAFHTSERIKRAHELGLTVELKTADPAAITDKKDRAVDLLSRGSARTMESEGITLIAGSAHFTASNALDIILSDGSTKTLQSTRIIIAAGSLARPLPGLPFDHTKIIDARDALDLRSMPQSLLIIGGGAIGVEIAGIYTQAGCSVTIAEKMPRLLPGEDSEISREVTKSLQRQGVRVITGDFDLVSLVAAASKVLVATGRAPNIDSLSLAAAGIAHTERGITVNDHCETNVTGIYAAGDVTGRSYLAYTAQADGIIAAENAMGAHIKTDYAVVPRVVFSMPPAAGVGAREEDMNPSNVAIGRFQLTASGRAFISGERTGWVKIIADRATGKILGGHVIGARAEDIITILAVAMRAGLRLDDLSRELFFHPSFAESLYAAVEDAVKTRHTEQQRR